MNYLLLLSLALGISFATHAMKREAPENNGEHNNEQPAKRAKTTEDSPFMVALDKKDKNTLYELNPSAEEINMADEKGYTPFIHALDSGDKEIIDFLLSHGARACPKEAPDVVNDFLITVIKGDLHHTMELLKGVDVNALGYAGYTPLMCASILGHEEIAKVLIEAGCNIHAKSAHGNSALHLVCRKGFKTIAQMLLDFGASPNGESESGKTPLSLAIQFGFTELVEMLLTKNADVNYVQAIGATPLIISVLSNRLEIVELLLKLGANVNQICEVQLNGKKELTPLLCAVRVGSKEIIRILLEAGADLNRANGVLALAVQSNNQENKAEIVQMLIQAGADVNQQDKAGVTALIFASKDTIEIVRLLLKAGAAVNFTNIQGVNALNTAVANKKNEIIEELLQRGANINACDSSSGATGLMLVASFKNYQGVAHKLIELGASVDQKDNRGSTALMYAAQLGNVEVLKVLLNAKADVNLTNNYGNTALSIAIANKQDEVIAELVKEGAHVSVGQNGLIDAVKLGKGEIVKRWLEVGVDVNQQNNDGWAALMVAAQLGHREIAKMLLAAKADVNLTNKYGGTALSIAIANKQDEVIAELVKQGAQVNVPYSDGQNGLIRAVKLGKEEIVKRWLEVGVDVNQRDNNKWTALMFAAQLGHREIAKMLLDAGADKSLALPIAVVNRRNEIAKELISRGYNVNVTFNGGKTPLMQAIINKDDAMVELLLKSKADVNQRDNNKWTPLMHAAQSGTLRLVKVLLDAGADKSLALPIAVRNRHKEIVKELISRGHNVNVILNDDDTPLMLAITNKDDAMMELLLEAKADVNQKGKKRTPLLYAAESGCEAIVDLLLKYKAEWDEEAVIKAAKNGHIALVSKLLGFAPMERRKLLATIFDIALTNGSLELASRLLALYVVLSGQSLPKYTHITPLRYFGEQEVDLKMARFFGDKETIAELETQSKVRTELEALITLCKTREIQDYLSKKPGVKATVKAHLESAKYMHTDKYKQTVLMWAAMFGHNDEVKKILATFVPLDEGALPTVTSDARAHNTALDRAVRYINAQDAAGRTALMYAILYGQNEAVKLLIPYCGSGVNLKDNQGYTALGYAAQKGNKELIKLLLGSGASIKVLAIKEVAEQNNDYLAASLLGQKRGQNIFGSLS